MEDRPRHIRLRDSRIVGLAILAVAVLVGVFAAVTWANVESLVAASRLADHTRDLIGELEATISLTKDAETGQRGYLLTGRRDYLDPYTSAVGQIRSRLRQIDELSSGDASRSLVPSLRALVERKLDELKQTIELRDSGSPSAAIALVDSNRGKRLMDEIRATADRIEQLERRQLGERTGRSAAAARATRVTLVVGLILTYGLLAVVATLIFRDIRARTAFAEERGRLYEEAQRALAIRDAFLSVAGHEFRTPIGALTLTLHNVQRLARNAGDQAIAERLAGPIRSVARLARLTEELLAVGRITAGHMEPEVERFDLSVLAAEVVERLREEATDAHSELRLDAPVPVVGTWDRSQIDQVLTNLLTNAIKFGRGSPVEITVGVSEAGAAAVVVRDHGIGISPEHQTRIFEKFERAVSDRAFKGIGLGLWIARELLDRHQGIIRVESQPGRGAMFRVELPIAPEGERTTGVGEARA